MGDPQYYTSHILYDIQSELTDFFLFPLERLTLSRGFLRIKVHQFLCEFNHSQNISSTVLFDFDIVVIRKGFPFHSEDLKVYLIKKTNPPIPAIFGLSFEQYVCRRSAQKYLIQKPFTWPHLCIMYF